MKIETDKQGKALPLVVPTQEEFDEWILERGFTPLCSLLDGYAAIHDTHQRIKDDDVKDPECIIYEAIFLAEMEIKSDIYNLFVCAFNDFAQKNGGAN